MLNVTGTGRLTKDIELAYTSNQTPVANFTLAWNRKFKGEDKPVFVDCTAFGKSAETLQKYVSKGERLEMNGELDLDRWEKDGQKRSKLKVIVNRFEFIGSEKSSAKSSEKSSENEIPNDEVPF